jgi:hypothetical protein
MVDSALPEEAAAFLRECVGEQCSVEVLAGDASVRRYFRVRMPDGGTHILAYYPREVRPQLEQFLSAYRAVVSHGQIPKVLQHSDAAVLQVDVGDRTLFDLLHEDRRAGIRLYRQAIDALVGFQQAPGVEVNAPFSSEFFLAELEMTREFYVEKLMGVSGSRDLIPWFRRLTDKLEQHPYILCHRDYHGQNIHILNNNLYVIDYQDLRMGPDTYDLASLLRDRGVARILGEDVELELVAYYTGLRGSDGDLRRRYFESLLQRSIKIIGTYAKMPIARGRLHYLQFIPPSIESVQRCLRELTEFAELARLFPLRFSPDQARERVKGILDGSAQDHAASR